MAIHAKEKETDYTSWTYIRSTIKRLRANDPAVGFMTLPTASLVRLAKDLGIVDPFEISMKSLRHTASVALAVGLFHDDLTEKEWRDRTAHSRFTMSSLTPEQFSQSLQAIYG